MPVVISLTRGLAVKLSKIEAMFARVFVRRAGIGAEPFTWELHGDGLKPIHVSGDRFKNMSAAYEAGQAWLEAVVASAGSCRRDGVDFELPPPDDHFSEMSFSP